MELVVATCQFPVSAAIRANARYVLRQLQQAADRGADVAHFCEGSAGRTQGHARTGGKRVSPPQQGDYLSGDHHAGDDAGCGGE